MERVEAAIDAGSDENSNLALEWVWRLRERILALETEDQLEQLKLPNFSNNDFGPNWLPNQEQIQLYISSFQALKTHKILNIREDGEEAKQEEKSEYKKEEIRSGAGGGAGTGGGDTTTNIGDTSTEMAEYKPEILIRRPSLTLQEFNTDTPRILMPMPAERKRLKQSPTPFAGRTPILYPELNEMKKTSVKMRRSLFEPPKREFWTTLEQEKNKKKSPSTCLHMTPQIEIKLH